MNVGDDLTERESSPTLVSNTPTKGKIMLQNGDKVILSNEAYGNDVAGTLHLPPLVLFSEKGKTCETQQAHVGIYGVYTIILPSGKKYRSEGTLARQ